MFGKVILPSESAEQACFNKTRIDSAAPYPVTAPPAEHYCWWETEPKMSWLHDKERPTIYEQLTLEFMERRIRDQHFRMGESMGVAFRQIGAAVSGMFEGLHAALATDQSNYALVDGGPTRVVEWPPIDRQIVTVARNVYITPATCKYPRKSSPSDILFGNDS